MYLSHQHPSAQPTPSYLGDRPAIAKSLHIGVGTVGPEIKQGSGFKSKQESGSHLPLGSVVLSLARFLTTLCLSFFTDKIEIINTTS